MDQRLTTRSRDGHGYIFAALTAYMGSYSVGAIVSYSSPVGKELEQKFADMDISMFGSLLTFGALFGCFFTAWLIEALGRRKTIMLSASVLAFGWIIIIFGSSSFMLYCSRLISGVPLGIIGGVLSTYVTEIATPEHRGVIGAGHQAGTAFGILCVYIFGSFMNYIVLASVNFLMCLGTAIGMIFMPESPEWMIKKRKSPQDIESNLHRLYGNSDFAESFSERINQIDSQSPLTEESSFAQLREWSALKPFLICLNICLSQQLCGVAAVLAYSAKIFEASGSTLSPDVQSIIIAVVKVAFTILAASYMDRAGRRLLMISSSASVVFALLLLVGFFSVSDTAGTFAAQYGWIPVVALSIYMAGYSLGIGPVPWLIVGELLPTRVRGLGTGILTCVNWSAATVITKVFPGLLAHAGPVVTYLLLAGLMTVSGVITYLTIPETKGKTLQEIEELFECKGSGATVSMNSVDRS